MQRTRPHRREQADTANTPRRTLAQRTFILARRLIGLLWGEGQLSPVGAVIGLLMLGLLALLAASVYQLLKAALFPQP